MTVTRVLAGRYRLDREIGRGSMGTVWDAYDEVLHRRVAIKEVRFPAGIPPAEADVLADRTLREARAIAALSHPHVITLFDIVTLPSGPVIVMELMIARSLADILDEHGPLPTRSAAVIGQAIAAGLTAAHGAGITHRDVKPANVLIADDGRIKLTDFGIARAAGEQTLTATGMLLGSPAYISPEVAAGRPAAPGADAWGLGALLFAMVEGHPPFDRGKPIATLAAVVSDPVPPHPHSGPLTGVIDGLLTKDPGQRMPVPEAERDLAVVADGAVFLPPPPGAPGATAGAEPAPPPAPAEARRTPTMPRATVPPPASPSLPPPPWSADAAATLRPLPAAAPPTPRSRVAITATVTAAAAFLVGFAGVVLIGWYA